ncbi:class I SAM-dependent methyltransferase [Bacillus spongiae]|uniref:Class I SAM-dependent methyltransferase n=1 Tax=Bacillus spongiae TaxID=2683610 RepID=A0ABU8HBL7_9BACI
MNEMILHNDDVLKMLDSFLREPTPFWNDFYSDRNKAIPFFENIPDENLVSYFEQNQSFARKILELGCGPGRNALFLAEQGCEVDAVDCSQSSLEWAKERSEERGVKINYIHSDLFDLQVEEGAFDFVYDSGCFHHIAPHRRLNYVSLVEKALKPGGYFALTCFVEGGKFGGANISDWEVYRSGSLHGGLGYSEEKLTKIFNNLIPVEIRRMRDMGKEEGLFGLSDLWVGLFQKNIE